jgi:hypothetical protein
VTCASLYRASVTATAPINKSVGRKRMDKPRIFLGSSGKQQKLLQALTRGLEDVAHVEPWTTSVQSWDHHAGAPP